MQLNNLSSMNFKGMIILNDEHGGKYSINPKAISSVTPINSRYQTYDGDKTTRIDMINGGVHFTSTKFEELMPVIEQANKTDSNIDLTA